MQISNDAEKLQSPEIDRIALRGLPSSRWRDDSTIAESPAFDARFAFEAFGTPIAIHRESS